MFCKQTSTLEDQKIIFASHRSLNCRSDSERPVKKIVILVENYDRTCPLTCMWKLLWKNRVILSDQSICIHVPLRFIIMLIRLYLG